MAVRFGGTGSGGGITALTIGAGATSITGGTAGRFLLEGTGPVLADDSGATFTGTGATFVATLNSLTLTTPLASSSMAVMTATVGGRVPTPPNNTTTFLRGDGTFAAPSASVTLDGIAAAAGAATIASGNNTGIVWNWANTTDSTVAFTFGETSAATNGTSTSGVPNQVLLKLTTLAASTQSPLSVYSRGTHVFSVSPSTAQILANSGASGTPSYSFAAATNYGMYQSGGGLILQIAGTDKLTLISNRLQIPKGTSTAPGITDIDSFANAGLSWLATHTVSIVDSTSAELIRFVGGTASVSYFTQSAVAFANLPAAANGSQLYCSDCDPATLINSTCASAGAKTGSMAARVNGAWICYT